MYRISTLVKLPAPFPGRLLKFIPKSLPNSLPAPLPALVLVLLPVLLVLAGCGNNDNHPDVSGVKVPDIHIERFDTAFFNLDSNHIRQGLYRLTQEYPDFTGDFVGNRPVQVDDSTYYVDSNKRYFYDAKLKCFISINS